MEIWGEPMLQSEQAKHCTRPWLSGARNTQHMTPTISYKRASFHIGCYELSWFWPKNTWTNRLYLVRVKCLTHTFNSKIEPNHSDHQCFWFVGHVKNLNFSKKVIQWTHLWYLRIQKIIRFKYFNWIKHIIFA